MWASRGGQMPKVMKDFIKRTTDPNQGDLTFSEARQFLSNAGQRLSTAEQMKMTPMAERYLSTFTKNLNDAIRSTAEDAGVLDDYTSAVNEYRQAMNLNAAWEAVKEQGVRILKYAIPGAATALRRHYSLNQVEYCRNFVFQRNFPIHKLFQRSAELGVFCLTADKIAQIFGVRKHKRLRGKLHSMLEKLDHGHHVLRVYCKSSMARLYEKFSTFLRLEICVNRLKDLGLKKGLENLGALREKLVVVTDRLAGLEAELLNVHVDFPLFQRLALPVSSGKSKIPGIKIQDTRMIRLMEVLLHGGPQLAGWRTAQMWQALQTAFALSPQDYTLNQLRYDLRKMKGHGLLERVGKQYAYRLTEKGARVCAMFILFHKRICGPLANTLFHHPPQRNPQPAVKIETAYHKADAAIQNLVDLVAA